MLKRLLITTVCLGAIVTSGCAMFRSKPDAEQDGDPEWLENLRSLKGTGAAMGVSREAREIEKSLSAR